MKIEVWIEGYLATGMEGKPAPAKLLGTIEADTFADACDQMCSPQDWQSQHGNYDSERRTVWGCRLFDNEPEARRRFG